MAAVFESETLVRKPVSSPDATRGDGDQHRDAQAAPDPLRRTQ